jgi:hypothetical protein
VSVPVSDAVSGQGEGISPFLSVLWALVPLLTLGWGTGFSFTYAAIRLRDRVLGAWAAAYFVVGLTSFLLVASSETGSGWEGDVGAALALLLMAGGSAHAFALRPQLSERRSKRWYRPRVGSEQELALTEAKAELERRREAREILSADPQLARQLCIGRPDLPRRFKDGGLVDANHAPATALAMLPGIGASLANGIVTTRGSVGGFSDLTDMSMTLGVAPQTLDEAAEFLVFPKHGAPDRP